MAITVTIPTVPSAGSSWTSWGNAIDQAARELQTNVTNLLTAVASQYVKPGSGIPSSDLATAVQSNLTLASTAYQKPAGGIATADLASAVVASLAKADSALQAAPVASVAGRTGAVTLTSADVGLGNANNTADADKPLSTATVAALAATPVQVIHGDTASTARPATSRPVFWFGSVSPTNALNGDNWFQIASSYTGALDAMATPYRAHSVRRLRAAYTGPLIKVRRSTDNVELDIGFTSAGDLDTTALAAHVGSGSGFVSVWYDQSGNARHIAQTTVASQPRIVNAGVNDALGTKLGLVFDGTDDYMFDSAPGLYAAGADSIAFVMSGTTATNGTLLSESNAATAGSFVRMVRASGVLWNVQNSGDNGTSNYASSAASSNLFDGAVHQGFYFDSGSAISTWKDQTAIHAALAAPRTNVLTPTRFVVGAALQTTISNFAPAKMGEIIAWGSDQTASRSTLSINEKSYFGTP